MKKIAVTATLLILIHFGSSRVNAFLQSNYTDPGLTKNNWSYLENGACHNGSSPNWWLHSDGINNSSITPCGSSVMGQNWQSVNGHYEVTLSFNNTANVKRCGVRTYYGLQPAGYIGGTKNILYFKDLLSAHVKVTILNNQLTGACDDESNPTCNQYACTTAPLPGHWGNRFGDTELIIGIPMYDETNKRNLFLEISPYWTKNAIWNGPNDDPNKNYFLFWGEGTQYELARIMITHPLVNKPVLKHGQTVTYDIDVLPIIKSLKWGRSNPIDWDRVHLGDAYVGFESFGWAMSNMTVSNFDFLYEKKTITILDLRQLLIAFTNIFDYNKIVANYGQ